MSRALRSAFVGVALAGLASVAGAQVCVSTPSFSAGSARLGGSAISEQDHSGAYAAQLALGTWNDFFAVGNYTHTKNNSGDGQSNGGGAAVGYVYQMGGANQVSFCPMVGVQAQKGSTVGRIPFNNHPQNTLDVSAGGSLGWVAASSEDLQVIPSIGLFAVHRSYKSTIVMQGTSAPTTTDDFGMFTGTIGFVFDKAWTLSPLVQVPLSETDGKVAYGLSLSYNFNLPKIF